MLSGEIALKIPIIVIIKRTMKNYHGEVTAVMQTNAKQVKMQQYKQEITATTKTKQNFEPSISIVPGCLCHCMGEIHWQATV